MSDEEKAIMEFFEERAGIREFCGGQTRQQAEFGAYVDCRKIFGVQALPRELVAKHLVKYKGEKTFNC